MSEIQHLQTARGIVAADLKKKDVEIAELKAEIESWKEECEERERSIELLANEMVYKGNSVSYIYDKKDAYAVSIDRQRSEIAELKAEIERLKADLVRAKDVFKRALDPNTEGDWVEYADRLADKAAALAEKQTSLDLQQTTMNEQLGKIAELKAENERLKAIAVDCATDTVKLRTQNEKLLHALGISAFMEGELPRIQVEDIHNLRKEVEKLRAQIERMKEAVKRPFAALAIMVESGVMKRENWHDMKNEWKAACEEEENG